MGDELHQPCAADGVGSALRCVHGVAAVSRLLFRIADVLHALANRVATAERRCISCPALQSHGNAAVVMKTPKMPVCNTELGSRHALM